MTQRILVDLLGFSGGRGGTETYAREICRRLPDALPDAAFLALTGRAGAEAVRAFFPGAVRVVSGVGAGRVSWAAGEVFTVNALARRFGADLVWTPANFGPVFRGVPRVSTMHDVIYHHAVSHGGLQVSARVSAALMTRTARTADAVITGSASAARELEEFMRVPASAVHVVPHGTQDPRRVTQPWEHVTPLGIVEGRPIVLSTGNRLPHKNFSGLLAAVATIPPAQRPLTVVTGGGHDDPLRRDIDRWGLERDVVLPGWVSAEQLESLYSVAALYVCPSLSEGFGLPVIDAMRRGLCVLAHDVAVLREVGGDAARYADATDAVGFGQAILSSLIDADPARAEAGRVWSQRFTWEGSAARTAEVFTAVLDRRG
ncbi:MAG: hypothetical protein ABS63_01805 [Microbacterium sp. SCN 70-27]|uniref:glycosyltransferase family 4 protein n=1 Tax=unclassified Microbacterium TaxID=2609290 RepID=UPI00086F5868|nr:MULTISPECIES: glycosyltransferase family 1 protein [unclassified Microbacterium]MBN9225386.1 glycosyltransferase family 4 protein [Microbacterium sp.]ODT29024.1 MAG: hypothetical protein ABS63_01805 [Microbacterium sp. SCN 70-27]